MSDSSFDAAEQVADAVLYEGYVLYPYRKSALKNQFRWQFGIIAPKTDRESASAGPSYAQSECLVNPGDRPALTVKIRFLQVQTRTVEEPLDVAAELWRACERVVVEGRELLSWEEAVPREVIQSGLPLNDLLAERTVAFDVDGGREVEIVRDASGVTVARIVRERQPVSFTLRATAQPCDELLRLTIRVENSAMEPVSATLERNLALRRSLVGCHALLGLEDGAFLSLIDPPPCAAAAAKSCQNHHWWPVLAGPEGTHDVMLCAPIILYDYPKVAPESPGDFFDATEIDELLTLRMLTLTDAEKREVAATDERARHILERAQQATPRMLRGLHGAIRQFADARAANAGTPSWEALLNPPDAPPPEQATVTVRSTQLGQGSRVRLMPQRRADAMDMFLTGRIATIVAVYRDLEDCTHVAVTLDDDPAADLHRELGRFFYFSPDEIVPLDADADAPAPE